MDRSVPSSLRCSNVVHGVDQRNATRQRIRNIEFLAADRKGFWEVRGYSNSAEPWFNDRYATE